MNKELKLSICIIITFILLVVFKPLSINMSDFNNESYTKNNKYEFINEPNMYITGYNSSAINGTLKNNTKVDKENVKIIFTLYDKDNNIIGTTSDSIKKIKSGDRWDFKAIIKEDNVSWFKLNKVDGF